MNLLKSIVTGLIYWSAYAVVRGPSLVALMFMKCRFHVRGVAAGPRAIWAGLVGGVAAVAKGRRKGR